MKQKNVGSLLKRKKDRPSKTSTEFDLMQAVSLIEAEQFADAEKLLQRAFNSAPNNPDTHNLLAVVECGKGNLEKAVSLAQKAVQLNPSSHSYWNNLGGTLKKSGRFAEAEAAFRRSLELNNKNPEAYLNLIRVLIEKGDIVGAHEHQVALAIVSPKEAGKTMKNFAEYYSKQLNYEKAIEFYENYIQQFTQDPEAYNNLGYCYERLNNIAKANVNYNLAQKLMPNNPQIVINLGNTFKVSGKHAEASAQYKRALELEPRNIEAHAGLCESLLLSSKYDAAYLYARGTLMLEDYTPKYSINPAKVFQQICDFDNLQKLDKSLDELFQLTPELLPHLLFKKISQAQTPDETSKLLALHKLWGEWAEGLAQNNPLPALPTRGKNNKIRIGFLSGDFKNHVVARFILPLFATHDRSKFEFYAYHTSHEHDHLTEVFIKEAHGFKRVNNKSPREVAQLIRDDNIDILFESSGHTYGSIAAACAYKPAPVIIEYVGYPFTMGMRSIDYYMCDKHHVPDDLNTLVEKPLIMPNAGLCFNRPPDVAINPVPPFIRNNGVITIGTMNSPHKMSSGVFKLWADVLNAIPNSRFLVVRPEANADIFKFFIAKEFKRHGIAKERLYFIANQPLMHYDHYNEMDFTLDTVPQTGGVTTVESLWMGVPVITMTGAMLHQRLSGAILRHVGLESLIAATPEDYVNVAVSLAGSEEVMYGIRQNLRNAMMESDLLNQSKFTADFASTMTELAQRHNLV